MPSVPTLARLPIGARLGLGFGALTLLLLVCAGAGLAGLQRLHDAVDQLVEGPVDRTEQALRMETAAEQIGIKVRNAALMRDTTAREQQLAGIAPLRSALATTRQHLASALTDPAGRQALQEVERTEAGYLGMVDAAVAALQADNVERVAELVGQPANRAVRESYTRALKALVDHEARAMTQQRQSTAQTFEFARWVLGLATALGFSAALVIGWTMTRSIVLPARRATAAARRIADGDLSETLVVDREDEMGQMLHAMRDMQQHLRATVQKIHDGAAHVQSASREIANGNQDLARRTEEQASALEQTAASMRQMAGSVDRNLSDTRQARELVGEAVAVASQGGSVVGQVVSTMDEISASSHRIGDIIGVIDGLAFQTNILALNASVEAARAGEQGRGFAVVAGEVRNLAQRSAGAAREIKALIGQSVDKVEAGHQLVQQAGSTMGEIVSRVQRITELIGDIADAARQQGDSIHQVDRAVAQLDESTQHNAALVEESAAAADGLSRQADELESLVRAFRLEAAAARTAAAPRSASAHAAVA